MAGGYTLKVRSGPRVERTRFAELNAALTALESRGSTLAAGVDSREIDLKVRRFEPVAQVVARLELKGPKRLRAGLDVRGDGSVEAFTGSLRRRVIEQRPDESPYGALARVARGEAG